MNVQPQVRGLAADASTPSLNNGFNTLGLSDFGAFPAPAARPGGAAWKCLYTQYNPDDLGDPNVPIHDPFRRDPPYRFETQAS
jgi:hypothetical protein